MDDPDRAASVPRRLPAGNGRGVQVRALPDGTGIQLALVSQRGNLVEDIFLSQDQVAALVAALEELQIETLELLGEVVRRDRIRLERRLKESYARNPWLNGEFSSRGQEEERYDQS